MATCSPLHNINMSLADNSISAFIGPSGCANPRKHAAAFLNRMYALYPQNSGPKAKCSIGGRDILGPIFRRTEFADRSAWCSEGRRRFLCRVRHVACACGWSAAIRGADSIALESALRVRPCGTSQGQAATRGPSLSGGQQQRCASPAIAVNPEVRCSDDRPRRSIISTLRVRKPCRRCARNICLVLVTHNLRTARVSNVTRIHVHGRTSVEIGPFDRDFHFSERSKNRRLLTGAFRLNGGGGGGGGGGCTSDADSPSTETDPGSSVHEHRTRCGDDVAAESTFTTATSTPSGTSVSTSGASVWLAMIDRRAAEKPPFCAASTA